MDRRARSGLRRQRGGSRSCEDCRPPNPARRRGKKEGKLLWYTTLIVNQALKPIKEAFEKKYPYVQVEYHRADSEVLAQRMLAEYQAKRYDVDVLDGTSLRPSSC